MGREKINITNYQRFFLDYHEGVLPEAQEQELRQFLEIHPELQEEFHGYEPVVLRPVSHISFDDRESLKRSILPVGRLSESNYEEWLAADAEDLLSPAEKELLSEFLTVNPFLNRDHRLYASAKLKPDLSVVYPAKRGLRKPLIITADFVRWTSFAAAAAAVMAFFILADRNGQLPQPVRKQIADAKELMPEKKHIATSEENEKKQTDAAYAPAAEAEVTPHSLPANGQKKKPIIHEEGKTLSLHKVQSSGHPHEETAQETIVVEATGSVVFPSENPVAVVPDALPDAIPSVQVSIDDAKAASVGKKSEKFLSLQDVLANTFRRKVLKEKQAGNKPAKITGIDALHAFGKGIGKVLGMDVDVVKRYNEEGELTAYSVSAGSFGLSKNIDR